MPGRKWRSLFWSGELSTIGSLGQGLGLRDLSCHVRKQSAHEVESALLILPLDREKNFTVRREIADRMTEYCVGNGGGQRKRRSHQRAERLIEAVVGRHDDTFMKAAIRFDGIEVTRCRLPHEAVSLLDSGKLSWVPSPRRKRGRRRLEAQPEFEEFNDNCAVGRTLSQPPQHIRIKKVPIGDWPDLRTSPWAGPDQAFGRQHFDGFTDRRPTDFKFRRKSSLIRDAVIRVEATRNDFVPKAVHEFDGDVSRTEASELSTDPGNVVFDVWPHSSVILIPINLSGASSLKQHS
jgi:hypothetical protein